MSAKRLLIVNGEIVKGCGYELHNCRGGCISRVSEQKKLYREQTCTGMKLPMAFGDISYQKLAEVLGLEAAMRGGTSGPKKKEPGKALSRLSGNKEQRMPRLSNGTARMGRCFAFSGQRRTGPIPLQDRSCMNSKRV